MYCVSGCTSEYVGMSGNVDMCACGRETVSVQYSIQYMCTMCVYEKIYMTSAYKHACKGMCMCVCVSERMCAVLEYVCVCLHDCERLCVFV